MSEIAANERSEIAFFDLETWVPTQTDRPPVIIEFGVILVCPSKLVELCGYTTLVRPSDLSLISSLTVRRSGITRHDVVSAPEFSEIADYVYDILNGRIWAGHNIQRFDWARIREAFAEIGRPPPEPKAVIDTLTLLTQKFGRRAGDMKMASLAEYFELGDQKHRSLDDARMNLEVLKSCATVLLLESDILMETAFLGLDEVSISNIKASLVPFYGGNQRIKLFHDDSPLQLRCSNLRVRFGINRKFFYRDGRPKLNFVVDVPPNLCKILDACDAAAHKLSVDSGRSSDWWAVVTWKNGLFTYPTATLHIITVVNEDASQHGTEIYLKESSRNTQKLVLSGTDGEELDPLFLPGSLVDAFFSLDPYDYQQTAGIRLVAKKLVIH